MTEHAPLSEQRETLQRKMLAQRSQIAQRLNPGGSRAYPRSMTLRFLTLQPALATKLFVGLATLVLGARYFKTLTTALTVARLVRSAIETAPNRLPLPKSRHTTAPHSSELLN